MRPLHALCTQRRQLWWLCTCSGSNADLKHASLPDHQLLSQPPQVGSCLQEYVTQLAMALLEQGRKPDNEGVTERIKRLVNEAVRASAAAQSAAAV